MPILLSIYTFLAGNSSNCTVSKVHMACVGGGELGHDNDEKHSESMKSESESLIDGYNLDIHLGCVLFIPSSPSCS